MIDVNFGDHYEYFDSIEEIIRYLQDDENPKYRAIGYALKEGLAVHDGELKHSINEDNLEKIESLEDQIEDLKRTMRYVKDDIEDAISNLDEW